MAFGKNNLLYLAGLIKNETVDGANTANRVGTVLENIINETDKSIKSIDDGKEQLEERLSSVSEAAQEALTTANEAGTSVALLKARHEKDVAQINAAHDRDFSGLNMRIEKLKESDVAIDASIKEQADRLTAQEGVSAANSRHIDELASNLESVSDELSEGVGDAQILARNALDNAAIYPFGGVYPLVDAMPDDGRIGFITSLKRFAKKPDNALLGEYNTEDGKARADRLFRDGNRLYRVGSDGLLEEYANSLLGATVENLGHEVVGIWDEINAVKAWFTYKGRFEKALRTLDYSDEDIADFEYFYTHFQELSSELKLADVEAAAAHIELKGYDGTGNFKILPQYPREWETDETKPSPYEHYKNYPNLVYAPKLTTSRRIYAFDSKLIVLAGINYTGEGDDCYIDAPYLNGCNLVAIGTLEGNIRRVDLRNNCVWLRYVRRVSSTNEWFSLRGGFFGCKYLFDLTGIYFTEAKEISEIFATNSTDIYNCSYLISPVNLKVTSWGSYTVFWNRVFKDTEFVISGDFKTSNRESRELMGHCMLIGGCRLVFPQSKTLCCRDDRGFRIGHLGEITSAGVNYITSPTLEKFDDYLYVKSVNTSGKPEHFDIYGIWEAETPNVTAEGAQECTSHSLNYYICGEYHASNYILPIGWGKNLGLDRISYRGLIDTPYIHIAEYDIAEALNRSVNSLYDRSKVGGYDTIQLVFSQWQFDLLTEETIANAVAKNYTITIN